MVAHFTLRTYDVNKVFFRKKMGFDDKNMVYIMDEDPDPVESVDFRPAGSGSYP